MSKRDEIAKLYLKGKTYREICKELKTSPTTIIKTIREKKLKPRERSYKLRKKRGKEINLDDFIEDFNKKYGTGHKDQKDMLYNLYIKQKKSTFDIGELIGVSHSTILRRLRELNIPIRLKGGYVRPLPEESELFNKFMSIPESRLKQRGVTEWAEYLGCTIETVKKYSDMTGRKYGKKKIYQDESY